MLAVAVIAKGTKFLPEQWITQEMCVEYDPEQECMVHDYKQGTCHKCSEDYHNAYVTKNTSWFQQEQTTNNYFEAKECSKIPKTCIQTAETKCLKKYQNNCRT